MSKTKIQVDAEAADAELQKIAEADTKARVDAQQAARDEVARLNADNQNGDTPPPKGEAPVQQMPTSDWEQRYKSLQGMFAKSNETIATLTGRVEELSKRQTQPAPVTQQQVAAAAQRLLTDAEVKDYGEEFIDVTKRAARELYDDKMAALEQRIEALQKAVTTQDTTVKDVAKKAALNEEDAFYNALDKEVPTWESVNTNSEFLTWLSITDTFTGVSRHVLLNQALHARDLNRVASFFKAFIGTSGAPAPTTKSIDASSLVSPGTVSSGPTNTSPRRGKYWTQAEVEQVYNDKMNGKITHEQFVKLESEALQAVADGRIR